MSLRNHCLKSAWLVGGSDWEQVMPILSVQFSLQRRHFPRFFLPLLYLLGDAMCVSDLAQRVFRAAIVLHGFSPGLRDSPPHAARVVAEIIRVPRRPALGVSIWPSMRYRPIVRKMQLVPGSVFRGLRAV